MTTTANDTNTFSRLDKYTIALFESGGTAVSGSFVNASNGDVLLTDDRQFAFKVHYGESSIHGGDRIVLTDFVRMSFFTAVPEPNSAVLFGLLFLIASKRRSREG